MQSCETCCLLPTKACLACGLQVFATFSAAIFVLLLALYTCKCIHHPSKVVKVMLLHLRHTYGFGMYFAMVTHCPVL